jgi:hypothetical protein
VSGRPPADPAPDEHGEYQIDHRSGYSPMPRDIINCEPLMREPSRLMLGIWVLIHCRVGRMVLYDRRDVDSWLDAHRCGGE